MDYDRAEKILENIKDKEQKLPPRHDLRIRQTGETKSYIADDPLIPLSFSGVVNPIKEITFVDDPISMRKGLSYVETFDNKFFDA